MLAAHPLAGFAARLNDGDQFGRGLAAIGDVDGDGTPDLAAGAPGDDTSGNNLGAVYILFMNPDGTVRAHHKIEALEGGVARGPQFGNSLAPLGLYDDDDVPDLAVGVELDDEVDPSAGAFWLLFLRRDGSVKAQQKITRGRGGFTSDLERDGRFGASVSLLPDLDGNGVRELAVGQYKAGPEPTGAAWVLLMSRNAQVARATRISRGEGGFTGELQGNDGFGVSVASVGDLDGDGVGDLAVGAHGDDEQVEGSVTVAHDRGAVWLLFLRSDGTVKGQTKIDGRNPAFPGRLGDGDSFGIGLVAVPDLDGNGYADLAVAAVGDDQAADRAGALWLAMLREGGGVRSARKIAGMPLTLAEGDEFGTPAALGAIGSGVSRFAVSAYLADGDGQDRGVVWIVDVETGSSDECVPQ